tara:strand:+ start:66 stop:539 length:474 start_codon:yes stop_codon:yes gene_type:complete
MFKHNFIYSIIEEFVKVDKETLKEINKIKLKKEPYNFTSYYEKNNLFNNFINKKLKHIFKKYNLTLKESWVQKYLKNNYHGVHTHNVIEKSFVWFIKGDKNSSPLYFYDIGYPVINTNQIIKINFIPNTLVIFPGFIPHEVRPNNNNNRLIISGNVF